jgi:hypothetical protein
MAKTRAKVTKGRKVPDNAPEAEEVAQRPVKRARVARASRSTDAPQEVKESQVATNSNVEDAAIPTPVLSEDLDAPMQPNPASSQNVSIPLENSSLESSKDAPRPASDNPIDEDDEGETLEPVNEPRASDLYLDTVRVDAAPFRV